MRIVVDTNLLVSGIISAGLPRELLNAAKAGEFELCTSEVLLAKAALCSIRFQPGIWLNRFCEAFHKNEN